MTKAKIRFVQSLNQQKYRKEFQSYIVEGEKNAKEWLNSSLEITHVFAEKSWISSNQDLLSKHLNSILSPVEDFELEKISTLKNAQQVILVVKIPKEIPFHISKEKWYLYLERVQDPGNMGTIIRTADWFGIEQIFISPDCVDIYNPKVVQATMGSLTRMKISEISVTKLEEVLSKERIPLYSTSLKGDNVFEKTDLRPGIIAFGNESAGISEEIFKLSTNQLLIPKLGQAESLNIGIAVGIICAVLTRAAS